MSKAKMIKREVPLVGAPHALPAGAQLEQRIAAERARREEERAQRGKPPRRKPGDLRPWPTGDPYIDVPAFRAWVERGRTTKADRRMEYRGKMMDLEEAMYRLDQETLAAAQHQQPQPQHPGYLPGQVSGSQHPTPPQLQTSIPAFQVHLGKRKRVDSLQDPRQQHGPAAVPFGRLPGPLTQGHFNMAQSDVCLPGPSQQFVSAVPTCGFTLSWDMNSGMPMSQPPGNLQANFTGFQHPFQQQLQASVPVPQVHFGLPQQRASLQDPTFQFDPELSLPGGEPDWEKIGHFDMCEAAGGLVSQPSASDSGYLSAATPALRDETSPQWSGDLQAAANADHAAALAAGLAQLQAEVPAMLDPEVAENLQPQQDFELFDLSELDNLEVEMDQAFGQLEGHIQSAEELRQQDSEFAAIFDC